MLKLGIVGAENSHAASVATLLNVHKRIKGFNVTHIWGETGQFAETAAAKGNIPIIVNDPKDMIGQVDCVMIDHRNGKFHLPVAESFVKAGIPVFVDKPLSLSLKEAKSFLKLRRKCGVSVTTLSAMPLQSSFAQLKKEFKKAGECSLISFVGPGDYNSKYGGLFFYFIHQVDMMVELTGGMPDYVKISVCGKSCTAQCEYKNGMAVTLTMEPSLSKFYANIYAGKATLQREVTTDFEIHLASAKIFTRMFSTGVEPFSEERMLMPIAVLESMALSLKLDKRIKVGAV